MLYKKQNNLAVVCNDAGGAEVISSWLKKKDIFFKGVFNGPAREIFKKKKLKYKTAGLNNAINNSSWIITGTSWSSKLELNAIKYAKKRKKYVVTFLDHWINYKPRFKSGSRYIYPDEIWVGDKDAVKIAKKTFKKVKIKFIKNPLWEDFKKEKKNYKRKKKVKRFLIATSNLDAQIFTKKTKLSDFEMIFKAISFIKTKFKNQFRHLGQISIKKHPSEKQKKYLKFIDGYNLEGLKIENGKNILNTIKHYSVLIGCETMLLVLGKFVGLKTYNIYLKNSKIRQIPKKYFNSYIKI